MSELPNQEPAFVAVAANDPAVQSAHNLAASTIPLFLEHIHRPGDHISSVKLKFRDPNVSAVEGNEQHLYIWLSNTQFDSGEDTYFAQFFEVPEQLHEWHHVGQQLSFDMEDVFDWMVNDDGFVHGGFTLRLQQRDMTSSEIGEHNDYIGVKEWAPVP